jgi:hypothetical protein
MWSSALVSESYVLLKLAAYKVSGTRDPSSAICNLLFAAPVWCVPDKSAFTTQLGVEGQFERFE